MREGFGLGGLKHVYVRSSSVGDFVGDLGNSSQRWMRRRAHAHEKAGRAAAG